ncbi:DUF1972 domain-containing protein [Microbacterium sp. LRZ72]|uniref:DUF1972 domain-containing protein n=1 Tax=Microbacterium sp. LRZ72 TaxID=2942481 RepID=UPI0029AC6122|nr:DUF1972 domain-containing protein [Microbacterium sp. LRZ72]MDX2377454.1 DUF1972 domain-containing protein [Microbacterium sp. LRZ72]
MVLEHVNVAAATRAPQQQKTLSIAMIGTRGVPAAYGGFETAIEEVGRRLVDRGHSVTVYTRGAETRQPTYLGMDLVHLPALRQKQLETLSHTGLSAFHAVTHHKPDAAFVFNAANAPFLPILRARGIPIALHMDGLEWKRSKWGARGKAYYRWAEEFGVRQADALIADAPGIADYYDHQFGVPTELIRYGAPILGQMPVEGIRALDLEPRGYHLVVARFEPENHVLEIVEGYRRSNARLPLVVVGSAPYAAEYTQKVREAAGEDPRIRFLGGVYDQPLLDALYAHSYTYVHGHSVGGTNPSLLRAMGAGAPVVAYDVTFNREVLNDNGWFFADPRDVTALLTSVEHDRDRAGQVGIANTERASEVFRWDLVADDYEALAQRLAAGSSAHRVAKDAHRAPLTWSDRSAPVLAHR